MPTGGDGRGGRGGRDSPDEPSRLGELGELGDAVARRARVVRVVPGGPMLVEGPVDVETPDGARVCSDRFMVAVCLCRRSKNYPMCDTSHRRKVRPEA